MSPFLVPISAMFNPIDIFAITDCTACGLLSGTNEAFPLHNITFTPPQNIFLFSLERFVVTLWITYLLLKTASQSLSSHIFLQFGHGFRKFMALGSSFISSSVLF